MDSYLAYSSNLSMLPISSFPITQRYNPDDRMFYNHRHENLISSIETVLIIHAFNVHRHVIKHVLGKTVN
jgi:hypothetical protein